MNEEKIYLMSRLAIFESQHREQLSNVQTCFRSDYIGRHMIKNGLRVTVAYLLILAGWGLYHAETLVVDITKVDIPLLAGRIIFLYAVMLAFFLVLTYSIQNIRYIRARKDLEEYRRLLDALDELYEREEQAERIRSRIR